MLDKRSAFWGKWFLLAVIVGITAGIVGILFQIGTEVVQHLMLGHVVGYEPQQATGEHSYLVSPAKEFRIWLILPVIGLGGLATGLLVYFFAEAEGAGTDGAINAFHHERGMIRWKTPIIKALASAITLGTGGSAGREGPIAKLVPD